MESIFRQATSYKDPEDQKEEMTRVEYHAQRAMGYSRIGSPEARSTIPISLKAQPHRRKESFYWNKEKERVLITSRICYCRKEDLCDQIFL